MKGWGYLISTVAALDLLHDAWFYWTHRWMHSWKPLYRRVHSLHHESTVPTAFTGYAFHPVEGVIVFLNEILVTFLFPIHSGLHRCYHLWTTVIHNGGHAGYEIAPFIPSLAAILTSAAEAGSAVMGKVAAATSSSSSSAPSSPNVSKKPDSLARQARAAARAADGASRKARAALNTVRHHDMHHRFPFAHFSLYFTHWDRALGTEHAGYRAAVEAHFAAAAKGRSEKVVVAAEEERGTTALSTSTSSQTAATDRGGGLERLASAMEEYALLSQRKQQQQQRERNGGKGGGARSSSGGGDKGAKSSRTTSAAAARPRSPGIAAWRPSMTEGAAEVPQQRRSSRLARAA